MLRASHRRSRAASWPLTVWVAAVAVAIVGVGRVHAQDLPEKLQRFTLPSGSGSMLGETPPGLRFDGSPQRAVVPPRTGRATPVFYDLHLLPRLNRQFREMGAYQAVPLSSDPNRQFVLIDLLTDTAQRRAERGTRKALVQFLLEETSLGQRVDGIRDGRALSIERGRGVSYGVGAYHGLPRFELRTRARAALLRFGVCPDGSVGLSISHQGDSRARFYTGYDAGDDEVRMDFRLSF